jgi:ribosomal protein L37E
MLITVIVPVLALLAGAVVLVRGWRGEWVLDRPACRRCGLDLKTVEGDACPACGEAVANSERMWFGHWEKRPKRFLAGVVIVLLAAIPPGYVSWNGLAGSTPTALLVRDARNGRPITRTPALEELARRILDSDLAPSQAQSLIEAGLRYQGDLSKPWDMNWESVLWRAQLHGYLRDDQLKRYYTQAVQLQILVRPSIRPGARLPFQIRLAPSRGDTSVLAKHISILEARLDDVPLKFDETAVNAPPSEDVLACGTAHPQWTSLNPGWHRLTMRVQLSLSAQNNDPNRPGAHVERTLQADTTVAPAGQAVTRTTLGALLPAVSVRKLRVLNNAADRATTVELSIKGLDANKRACFDVILKNKDAREWKLGQLQSSPGTHGESVIVEKLTDFYEQSVQVILRPNAAAQETVDILEGEVPLGEQQVYWE